MIAGTHIAFASVLYLGGAALFEYDPDLLGWALAAGASLLPDVDLPTSQGGTGVVLALYPPGEAFWPPDNHPFLSGPTSPGGAHFPPPVAQASLFWVHLGGVLVPSVDWIC